MSELIRPIVKLKKSANKLESKEKEESRTVSTASVSPLSRNMPPLNPLATY
jgi:hypothetical protein